MEIPSLRAISNLPPATTEVAISRTKGGFIPAGTATAKGLVPIAGLVLHGATTAAQVFVIAIPIISRSKAIIA